MCESKSQIRGQFTVRRTATRATARLKWSATEPAGGGAFTFTHFGILVPWIISSMCLLHGEGIFSEAFSISPEPGSPPDATPRETSRQADIPRQRPQSEIVPQISLRA
jgi:hypothetical protein